MLQETCQQKVARWEILLRYREFECSLSVFAEEQDEKVISGLTLFDWRIKAHLKQAAKLGKPAINALQNWGKWNKTFYNMNNTYETKKNISRYKGGKKLVFCKNVFKFLIEL